MGADIVEFGRQLMAVISARTSDRTANMRHSACVSCRERVCSLPGLDSLVCSRLTTMQAFVACNRMTGTDMVSACPYTMDAATLRHICLRGSRKGSPRDECKDEETEISEKTWPHRASTIDHE